jgi:hypothetical protein
VFPVEIFVKPKSGNRKGIGDRHLASLSKDFIGDNDKT